MPFGELPYLDNAAIPQERPFEGASSAEPDAGLLFARYLFPELSEWQPLLRSLDIPLDRAAALAALARKNGTDFQTELLISGEIGEEDFYRALAVELGLGYAASLEPERLIVTDAIAAAFLRRRTWHIPVKIAEKDGATCYLIAPEQIGLGRLRQMVESRPAIACRLKVISPKILRGALFARVRPILAKAAVSDLFDRFPDFSARIVANAWQGSVLGAALVAFPAALWVAPGETWAGLHFFFSFFFLACVGLRFAALRSAPPRASAPAAPVLAADLPVYSVLVALYKEAAIVPSLVEALDRIAWPKSKLEIKLVCEEDDFATLEALRALALPRNMEVVEAPVFGPRTKPKALAYAFPLVSGEFVALYDAEDHPHPMQLVHAWQKFEASAPDLACVQAPLEISNRGSGPVSLMFGFEYAALFRGLLPWLSRKRLLLPLGGTSNHFRRAVLEDVGGWDPYNVTEDADLGVRLARFGYRTETVPCPTYEAAPDTLGTWLLQRTRWFKGWMQTWLVHMRDPFRLARDLGFGSFLIAQILFAGMVVSALAHPFLVLTAFVLVARAGNGPPDGHLEIGAVCGRRRQHRLRLSLIPAARLADAGKAGTQRLLEDRAVHAGLLDDDVGGRVARRLAAVARSASLGKDAASGGARGSPRRAGPARPYSSFGPSPMIFGSGLPIASRSRPA